MYSERACYFKTRGVSFRALITNKTLLGSKNAYIYYQLAVTMGIDLIPRA